jgi:hypothetical protein
VIRRVFLGLLLLGTALAVAADPALPGELDLKALRVHLSLSLDTRFTSSEHRLRSMSDEATLETDLDLEPLAPREGLTPVVATPRTLAIKRHKHARIAGFFSESEEDARGAAAFPAGDVPAPAPWRLLVSPRGAAFADTTPVSSSAGRWPLEGWLHERDRTSDEDARLRRLVHSTDLGTLLGAPPLPAPGATRFEATFPLVAGESGLTNKLVDLELVYDLKVAPAEGGLVRVAGPLARVRLVHGEGTASKGPDQWLDVAFAHGGPKAEGEIDALFDPAKGRWKEVRSSVTLSHEGRFDGGSGRATFARTLHVTGD